MLKTFTVIIIQSYKFGIQKLKVHAPHLNSQTIYYASLNVYSQKEKLPIRELFNYSSSSSLSSKKSLASTSASMSPSTITCVLVGAKSFSDSSKVAS